MAVRRLAPKDQQPEGFSFTAENKAWAEKQIAKYPEGRQWSAVIALMWRAQEQAGGWLPEPAIRHIAEMLEMSSIRALEIATFYTMFNLAPRGEHLVQVCTTTPCWLRGSDAVVDVCKRRIADKPSTVSADGKFSWMEVECLGACVNAPMVQINDDYYEDLTGENFEAILDALAKGEQPKTGPQSDRVSSEPLTGRSALLEDPHRA